MELARKRAECLSKLARLTHAVVEHGFGAKEITPFAMRLCVRDDFKLSLSNTTHRVTILFPAYTNLKKNRRDRKVLNWPLNN